MKTIAEKYSERDIPLPKPITYGIVRFVFRLITFLYGTKFVYHFDRKEMRKKQVILLSEHGAFDSYIYTLAGYPFQRLNFVVGYHHVFNRIINSVGFRLGIIPKRNFEVDLRSLRHMVKIINKGGSLCVFPEGTFSFSGSNHAINPSTANFVKQLGVTVVSCKAYGTFNARPVFKRHSTLGFREIQYEIMFTPEELKELSVEEINERMLKSLTYNDLEWNKQHKYRYFWPFSKLKGIETYLYTCPKCHSQFKLDVNGRDLVCKECGNTVRIDKFYELKTKDNNVCDYNNMAEWYIDQRKDVKKEIQDPNFSISYECDLYGIHQDKPRVKPNYIQGEGTITINKDYIIYKGTRDGETVNLEFDIKLVPCFKYDVKKQNILNYHNEYFAFRPKLEEDKQKTMKYMMIVEELHNLNDDVWAKAYEDAYGA